MLFEYINRKIWERRICFENINLIIFPLEGENENIIRKWDFSYVNKNIVFLQIKDLYELYGFDFSFIKNAIIYKYKGDFLWGY